MHISRLQIRLFRNLKKIDIAVSETCNVFFGKNAQGKTNLLESIYMLSGNRSRRSQHHLELIHFGENTATVIADVATAFLSFEAMMSVSARGLKYSMSGKRISAANMGDEGIKTIMFTPDDLQIPKGSPSDRRRLIDQSMAVLYPEYKKTLLEYDRVLKQRNILLKKMRDRSVDSSKMVVDDNNHETNHSLAQVSALDQQLSSRAARIIVYRRRFIDQYSLLFSDSYAKIVMASESCNLVYQCKHVSEEITSEKDIESCILSQLKERMALDTIRATTSIGPHRDDLCFEISGKDAKKYGSQGQIRCLMLAYKIAQINDIYNRHGEYPLLLLDDMSSELDEARNNYLHRYIADISCQVFLTTTRPDILPQSMSRKNYIVADGIIDPNTDRTANDSVSNS